MAPTINNLIEYYNSRIAQNILSIRKDTLSQLLNLSNIRPGGRYLLCDDTGGLVLAAILERMGGHGRVMCLTDIESPPAWPVVENMNFGQDLVDQVVVSLNWAQAEEDYVPVEAVDEVEKEEGERTDRVRQKEQQKNRKRKGILDALNVVRDELHRGNWDGWVASVDNQQLYSSS